MAKIAVIIVNYGTAMLALEGVSSVLTRAHRGHEVSVHLVDNASPGGDAALIRQEIKARGWQGRLTFHAEAENHGFGRGNNLVLNTLSAAPMTPDYVFLLNPDAVLENETLEILADFLEAHPQAGAAGAEIRKPGEPEPVTAAFRFPGLASTFAAAINFGPITRLFDRWRVALPIPKQSSEVDWVAGAAVMARFAAWREVDFFDPDYFLYYEEVDLMRRCCLAGWQTWYVPEARALHTEGEATGVKSGQSTRRRHPAYLYASWRMYFVKNHGRLYALAAAILWLLGGAVGSTIAALRGRASAMPLHYGRDIFGKVILPLLSSRPAAP
ncbi:MAG: glycosyltransferase family 2 protein [Pseudomonadota bacterium]